MKEIYLSPSSGGLRLVTRYQLASIKLLDESYKTRGVIDNRQIVMFPDEIEAVRLAFEFY